MLQTQSHKLKMLQKIKQIKAKKELNESCPICQETLRSKNLSVLSCGHSFHFTCGMQWHCTHDTCPLCRTPTGQPPITKNTRDRLIDRYGPNDSTQRMDMLTVESQEQTDILVDKLKLLEKHSWMSIGDIYMPEKDKKIIWKTLNTQQKTMRYYDYITELIIDNKVDSSNKLLTGIL